MTRPGDRLRRVLWHLCSPDTMERLVDPAVADLQAEHAAAMRLGRPWTGRALRLTALVALTRALAWHGWLRITRDVWDPEYTMKRSTMRLIDVAVAVGVIAFFVLQRSDLVPAPVQWAVMGLLIVHLAWRLRHRSPYRHPSSK